MVRWPEVRYWVRAPRTAYLGSEPWQSTQPLGSTDYDCETALSGKSAAQNANNPRNHWRAVIAIAPGRGFLPKVTLLRSDHRVAPPGFDLDQRADRDHALIERQVSETIRRCVVIYKRILVPVDGSPT